MAPAAKATVARIALLVPVGVDVAGWNQNEQAIIVVYIEKVEGKKAILSVNLKSRKGGKTLPTAEDHIPADKRRENKT